MRKSRAGQTTTHPSVSCKASSIELPAPTRTQTSSPTIRRNAIVDQTSAGFHLSDIWCLSLYSRSQITVG